MNRLETFARKIFRKLKTHAKILLNRSVLKARNVHNIDWTVTFKEFHAPDMPGRLRVVLKGGNGLERGVVIKGTSVLEIGARSYIGEYSVIGCNAGIRIGQDVMIAAAVTIRDTDHNFARLDIPMNQQGVTSQPIEICDDVWIGHGATILKGVTIGQGAIIAAGAVITSDVAPHDIVGGVPGRVIGGRQNDVSSQ